MLSQFIKLLLSAEEDVLFHIKMKEVEILGGKEASRGFLYQAFASVLEALCQKNWDKIYIELKSNDDKVDIALEENGRIIKSIQVKSTINTFSKSSIQTWLSDLIRDDVGSAKFELFLIGQCDDNAITFINSIDKFYQGELDAKAEKALIGFDINIIKDKEISFSRLPYDVNILHTIVVASLLRYVSYSKNVLTFDQIDLIASATVNDQMISSTHGKGIDRKEFDEELQKRITLVADSYTPERISIGVKSFICEGGDIEEETESCLSLTDMFDDRKIKDEYNWNNDVYEKLKEFLFETTSKKQAYQIYLDTHTSIAFAAGRILNSKIGINIFPMQKTATKGIELWDVKLSSKRNYCNWDILYEIFSENQYDTALILNVTRSIHKDVIDYIKENNLTIGRIINCTPSEGGTTNFSIVDGNHAAILANAVYNAISQRTTKERQAVLHIFASAPNAFMFFLGQNSMGFGKCILYEYDFEQRKSCSYSPSIDFTG